MLKQNQESQSSAGGGISEGCEGQFQYSNMEGTVSKMWAPPHVVGNLVTEDREVMEGHSLLPLFQVLTGEVCAQSFGYGLGCEVLSPGHLSEGLLILHLQKPVGKAGLDLRIQADTIPV